MTLRLNGATSGFTEIDAPAVAGSNTLVLPGGNGSADQALITNGSGTLSFADRGRMVLETAQSATGTEVDFTSIPSWVKRVTVMFAGVSTNGASNPLFQLGAGSVQSSGYLCASGVISTPNTTNAANYTTGFGILSGAGANVIHGSCTFSLIGSNVWAWSMTMGLSTNTNPFYGAGSVTLSGTLDRVRITTVNGTDTFDAGTINIMYE